MNKLGQFSIILAILYIGEFFQTKFNLPIPGTILGLILLFALMALKILKLKWVEGVGDVLLSNLSLLFVPAGIDIIKHLDIFKGQILNLFIVIATSTIIVMVVTGKVMELLDKDREGRKVW